MDFFGLGFAFILIAIIIRFFIYEIRCAFKNIKDFIKNKEIGENARELAVITVKFLIMIIIVIIMMAVFYGVCYGIGWVLSLILCNL
jgi:heme/copper-type cytochrome/quinol oxidase subunit 2